MAAFLDVILRGLALAGQAVAVGGVLFALLVVRDGGRRRVWPLVAAGGVIVVAAQVLALVILTSEVAAPGALGRLAATQYFHAALGRILAAAVLVLGALAVRRADRVGSWWPL